jgi:5-methylcytosine-specific restriction endonuclease McrA
MDEARRLAILAELDAMDAEKLAALEREEAMENLKSYSYRLEVIKELMAKWGGICIYCRKEISDNWRDDNYISIDHFIPKALGGGDEFTNLAPCCRQCNSKKGDMHPAQYMIDRLPEFIWLQSRIKFDGRNLVKESK